MSKISSTPLTDDEKQEVLDAFNLFDTDGIGFLDARDLRVAMRALGFEPSKQEIETLLAQAGRASKLDLAQFTALVSTRMSSRDTREELVNAFQLFDDDKTGILTLVMLYL
jgi:Ca2+-binding EF-hand superfamily protein